MKKLIAALVIALAVTATASSANQLPQGSCSITGAVAGSPYSITLVNMPIVATNEVIGILVSEVAPTSQLQVGYTGFNDSGAAVAGPYITATIPGPGVLPEAGTYQVRAEVRDHHKIVTLASCRFDAS